MICDCPCHQNPDEKSNCGTCGNTGIILTFEEKQIIGIKSLNEKPIYNKNSTDLKNSVILSNVKTKV